MDFINLQISKGYMHSKKDKDADFSCKYIKFSHKHKQEKQCSKYLENDSAKIFSNFRYKVLDSNPVNKY